MKPILKELGRICRAHVLEPKVLLVPSLSYGKQLVARGALSGIPILNLHVKTVRQLAIDVLEELQGGCSWTEISEIQALFLLEKVCASVLAEGSYFYELRGQEGFWRSLWSTLQELGMAGADLAASSPAAFEDSGKRADLISLAAALDREMTSQGLIDGPGLLKEAMTVLSQGGDHPFRGSLFLVPENLELAPLERRFLNVFGPGESCPLPDRAPGRGWPEVYFATALGEEAELRGVLREVLKEEVPFEGVQVLWTDTESYLPLARDLSTRLGIPATFGCGVPLGSTFTGKAVLALLDWMRRDCPAFGLIRMFLSGFVELSGFCPGEEGFPRRMECVSLLREAAPGWGAGRYAPALVRLAEGLTGSEWKEDRAAKARLLVKALSVWLAGAPAPIDGEVSFGKVLAFVAGTLEKGIPSRAGDGAARSAVAGLLEEMQFAVGRKMHFGKVLDRIRGGLEDLWVGREAPSPGMIHFEAFPGNGPCLRDRTFLLGLDGSRFPGAGLADPILLDGERAALSQEMGLTSLILRSEEPMRQRERGLELVASLEGRLTCSFPCRSFAAGRDGEAGPSPFLLDLARRTIADPALDYEGLRRLAGEPWSFIPDGDPLEVREATLLNLEEAGMCREDLRARFFGSFPWLEEGWKALDARSSDSFTEYDGKLVPNPDDRDPRITRQPLSCSRLESLARCPLQFFFEHVLRVEPLDEGYPDPWVWLDAMQRGELLHAVFERFMRELRDRGEKPCFLKQEARIVELAQQELDAREELLQPPSEAVQRAVTQEIFDSCRIFLRNEEERCRDVDPAFMEVAFGTGEAASAVDLGTLDPVEESLDDGTSFLLRGRIDRVDRREDGSWEVWDYKTGKPFFLRADDPFDGGRKIQHALYARAAKRLLEAAGQGNRVALSGYLFTGTKGQGQSCSFDPGYAPPDEVLRDLFGALAEGSFPGTADENVCRYCPWKGFCGSDPGRVERLLKDSGSPELAMWRRLNGYA